ncbi:MAG: hypothetical protein A2749_01200 [Parcubacteria group bacterium RIFCSPHIGHO2_01_FULL_45_26]|nr:MAG: hypothetical protein A2749_01200 [Parcubacteria group bacterium RIFCSPHIGHO2_01_FULL_45_26]
MDTSIRTSFIPKAPLTGKFTPRKSGLGFLTFLSFALLLVSLIGWGAVFAYKSLVNKDVSALEGYLVKAKESFDPSLLKVFENLDRRIKGTETLLGEHTVLSPFFDLLGPLTLKSVRFDSFSLVNNESVIAVKMSGQALDFPSIALQALEFNKDKRIVNTIFSNLDVEDDEGTVSFDVSLNILPEMISYSETIINNKTK